MAEREVMEKMICGTCKRSVRIRKDGLLAKHNMDVGRGWNRGVDVCPKSETPAPQWARRMVEPTMGETA